MDSTRTREREQQRIEERCAAAIRALTGEPDLHFRGHRLHRGHSRTAISAPHLQPDPGAGLDSFRGAADGLALRLQHSDPCLHRTLRPDAAVPRLVFDMLEQFRVESLVPRHLPGVLSNLRYRHVAWSLEFHHSGLTETARGIVVYTVAQVCRSRVTGQPVAEQIQDVIEDCRAVLAPRLGSSLAGLRRERHDQQRYATHSHVIADVVGQMLQDTGDESDGSRATRRRAQLPLLDEEDDSSAPIPAAGTANSRVLAAARHGYRVFTTDHDRELAASALVRPALLVRYRQQLDQRIAAQGINVPWLARRLQAVLAEPDRHGWDGGQEEGHLDGRRLAQLVASPAEHRVFRTERVEPRSRCVVTFLIDCSGSMSEHAEATAVLVDVFARALDQIGASSEILGYTTGAWNGGRALRDWRRAGRPGHPGRLNERRHLVFKTAEIPWRRARRGIAALLKTDLYREGVDGEAVTWACRRSHELSEQHRVLVVVSDGSPMDGATNLTNDEHYLDQHLTETVRHEERAMPILGLGVGLDLSSYYSRSHALDLSAGTGNAVLREVLEALAGVRHR